MRRFIIVTVITLGVTVVPACKQPPPMEPFRATETAKDYSRPLPPGALALRKIDPEDYPDFSRGFYERAGMSEAIAHSLDYLGKQSSRRYFPYGAISHSRAVATLEAFSELLDAARSPADFDAQIRARFDVYQSVGCDDCGTVYFTGYYTPIFDGRAQRDSVYRYPLYRLPPDLVKDADGQILGRRTPDNRLTPYPTRREIEEHQLLQGHEIAWLKDAFEAYIVSVQGSARLRMADGTLWELGYAGSNGREYTSVGNKMVEDGLIGRDQLSLNAMIDYFRAHPDQVQPACWANDRYIFFQETSGGPFGSIGTPVTEYRTIATDKEVFPRACLAFVDTRLSRLYEGTPQDLPFASFVLDQDTGGAIRAAGRCDVYMGVGDQAGIVAGRTGAEGQLYYIFVKGPDDVP